MLYLNEEVWIMKFLLGKYFEKTHGLYPFFKYCPKRYWDYYINKRASLTLGYEYNFYNPQTLNEKIRWLIYNEKLELKTKLSDKISVKGYVASKLGANHSAELYGIYDNFGEIDFSILPDEFALKANHGWRMNILSKNKSFIYKNYKDIEKITSRWLKINYEEFSVEPQYRNIKKKLLVEQLRKNDNFRKNIQVYCFNGKPLFIELNQVRDSETQTQTISQCQVYDSNWKLQDFTMSGTPAGKPVAPPDKLDKILEYAEILSKEFSFVRVDFSFCDENIHVVEMTFSPYSAMIPFGNRDVDVRLGEMLIIPQLEGVENV